jgi:iron-sulfur cluster repair protein YtfE (RIC family)
VATKATAKSAGKSKAESRASTAPDALEKLKSDHDDVKDLLDEYEDKKDDMSASEKKKIVSEICMELMVHAQIEEEIFYPAARGVANAGLDELLDEAEVEHAAVKDLIAQLEGETTEAELYDAKVTVLGEQVKHHVEEEEKEMFPKVKKGKLDLQALGQQLAVRAEELKAGYEAGSSTAND